VFINYVLCVAPLALLALGLVNWVFSNLGLATAQYGSPHYSHEDHVELDFPISLSMWLEISTLCCAFAFLN